jgi:hypothetical protein
MRDPRTIGRLWPWYAAHVGDCRALDAFDLIPVVEIEPKGDGTPLPNGSAADNPAGWDAYWRACLSRRGFPAVEPIEKPSWLVQVALLSDAALRAVLPDHLDAAGCLPITEPENVGSLCGGFVLSKAKEHLVRPSCCGDLSNIRDWEQAAGCRQSDWTMLWIGHPWVSLRFEASQLWISNHHEGEPTRAMCRFHPAALEKATADARVVLAQLATRLESHVASYLSGGNDVRQVCRRLAGLETA